MKTFKKKWKVAAKDEASPLMHALNYVEAAGMKMKKIIGLNDRNILIDFHQATWKYALLTGWTIKENGWQKLGNLVLNKLEKEPVFLKQIYLETEKAVKKLIRKTEKAKKANLSKFTNQKLYQTFKKIYEYWLEMNRWGGIPNLADFEHFTLTNKLMAFLEKKVKPLRSKISAGEAYGILGSPIKRSKIQESEMRFFRLLEKIQNNKKTLEIFKDKNPEVIISKLSSLSPLFKAIQIHTQKYDWLSYHYDGPVILDEKYFIELLSSTVRQKISGRRHLKKIVAQEIDNKRQKQSLLKQLKLDSQEKFWAHVASVFSYLKGLRKDAVFMASRNTDNLIKEISKRLSLTPKQLRHLTPKEVKKALLVGKINVRLINERINHCVTLCDDRGIKLFSGKAAEKYSKMIYEEKADKNIKEIKGTPAYPGKVRAMVKLIASANEMSKMNQGDVLVSPATNPNLVPAMKKASAIVTDEGGVTCHAAIVSRELKIPCVIGTKIATKVLKDGDLVEVEADKGVIKKI
ncbi:MAG: phosphoenolpyruvate synthase [uncultured bacterium]|nr:MAG: phosphoenolpyruvate synthase [uncultured bacterium]